MKKLYETITAENWIKQDYGVGQKRKCLSGHSISMNDSFHEDRIKALSEAIHILFPERNFGSRSVMSFNDDPNTTIEDIIRVCKIADV